MRSTVSALDRAPDGVDRLRALERLVDDLERRDVVERDDGARPALERTQLVEHAVLRDLEEPGREPRPVGEALEALEDAQEDLLRQVLGEVAVADEAQDVVVDGLLVRPDDQGERPLVSALGLPEHTVIGLRQGQCAASIPRRRADSRTIYDSVACQRLLQTRLVPVIAAGVETEQVEDRRCEVGELAAVAQARLPRASGRAGRGSSCARCAG